jgi:hypothetical protein
MVDKVRTPDILEQPEQQLLPLELPATGVVNIIGDTIRNSSDSCLTSSAIAYEAYQPVVEIPGAALRVPRGEIQGGVPKA